MGDLPGHPTRPEHYRAANLPSKASYCQAWRFGLQCAREGRSVWSGRAHFSRLLHGDEIRAFFVEALQRRINARAGLDAPRGRKDSTDQFFRYWRDAQAIRQWNNGRVTIHRFETAEARARFAHLLSSPE